MRPFLLLSTRPEDVAAEEEYAAILRFGELQPSQLTQHRLDQAPLGPVDLSRWSGIILGGSPFTTSVPAETKTAAQVLAEREITTLLDSVVPADFPFLGACYGIGTLGGHQGATVDGTYGEPVSAVEVTLTDQGRQDPLLGALPARFGAFVGHKEAIRELPGHAVLLASSETCPVQAFRIGRNVYATQFHPELDVTGIQTRIEIYRHEGYFAPEAVDELKRAVAGSDVQHPPTLIGRFVELYGR